MSKRFYELDKKKRGYDFHEDELAEDKDVVDSREIFYMLKDHGEHEEVEKELKDDKKRLESYEKKLADLKARTKVLEEKLSVEEEEAETDNERGKKHDDDDDDASPSA